jgi:hypothetical protein
VQRLGESCKAVRRGDLNAEQAGKISEAIDAEARAIDEV